MPLVGLNADGKIYQGKACSIERLAITVIKNCSINH